MKTPTTPAPAHVYGPLSYIGAGAALPNVPARDLTAAEQADLAERVGITTQLLFDSGLYTGTDPHPAPRDETPALAPDTDQDQEGDTSDGTRN